MSSSKSQQLNVLQSSGAYGGDCLACLLGVGAGGSNLTGWSAVSSASTGCFRPVAFGVQYRSGCTLSVTAASLQTNCALYGDVLKTLLWNSDSGQVPTYVAAFGNASSDEPGNWVPLLSSTSSLSTTSWVRLCPAALAFCSVHRASLIAFNLHNSVCLIEDYVICIRFVTLRIGVCCAQDSNAQVCKNMVVGLDLQFLYTATNSLANPQYKVIGAMYTFVQQDVYFRVCYYYM